MSKKQKDYVDSTQLANLTRQQLRELEEKEKTTWQKVLDWIIMILPLFCGAVAVLEYWMVPNGSPNDHPYTYVGVLAVLIGAYLIYFLFSVAKKLRGDKTGLDTLRYRAPLFSALFLLLAGYDYLTLKTGILTQPFVPCMNYIINIAWIDRAYLLECTLHTLRLLFLGYFIGIALGLVTGITCGYSERVRYWVNPVIKFLGPIPTSTWIPIVMVVATSLFKGAVFIIALGSWFAVTVASMTSMSQCGQGLFRCRKDAGSEFKAVGVPGCDSSCDALHSSGLYPGHEFRMRGNHDCRDDGCKSRPWLVYELGKIMGGL